MDREDCTKCYWEVGVWGGVLTSFAGLWGMSRAIQARENQTEKFIASSGAFILGGAIAIVAARFTE